MNVLEDRRGAQEDSPALPTLCTSSLLHSAFPNRRLHFKKKTLQTVDRLPVAKGEMGNLLDDPAQQLKIFVLPVELVQPWLLP